MKKEQLPLAILAFVSLAALFWAFRLNSTCQELKNKKIELENRLSQALKDKEFIRAQLDALQKKFDNEIEASRSLIEELDRARNTIEELQAQIVSLTKAKQEAEKEWEALKAEGAGAEEATNSLQPVVPEGTVLP